MRLNDAEIRVLGALAEKEMTVPETYPMTVNALVTASNQTTNRFPVMQLTAAEVEAALDSLRTDRHLVRKLFAGAGSRTDKYRHVLDEHLELSRPEKAILTVLLLRGAQTPGELKARTDRMHDFAGLEAVERVLDRLGDPRLLPDPEEPTDRRDTGALRSAAASAGADRADGYARPWDGPLVVRLERQPGQKEARFAHTLGATVSALGEGSGPSVRSTAPPSASSTWPATSPANSPSTRLAERVEELERQLAQLRAEFDTFRSQF
jgi:uncharacterized protein YceH (UPF0502 family)